MKKGIKKYHLHSEKQYEDDIEYWKKIPPEEKLNQIQLLREQYVKLFNRQKLYNESRKGLRRIYKIVKLS